MEPWPTRPSTVKAIKNGSYIVKANHQSEEPSVKSYYSFMRNVSRIIQLNQHFARESGRQ